MKNLNLIERLWTDSHEKQSPQRFARYAAMLIMLLTLGVGQMWAADMYIKGERNSWNSEKMTEEVSGSKWTFIAYWQNGTDYDAFKITSKTDWSGLNLGGNGSNVNLSWGTKSGALYDNGGSKDIILPSLPTGGAVVKITVTKESSSYYVKAEKLSEEGNSWVDINAPKIYWDNTNATYTNVSMLNGRVWAGYDQALGSVASALTHISNTNLWYNTSINNVGNAGKYTTTLFVNANWSSWETNVATKRAPYATSFTASNTTSLNSNTYLYSAASGNKGATLSRSQLSSGYSELNKTQTIEVYVKAAGGSYTKKTSSWPGTLTPDRYYLSNATTATHVDNTPLTASSSVTVSAVLTSAFSLSESATATGYNFDGWGTSSGATPSGKNAPYSISAIRGANTICAFFSEKTYTVTVNNDGHGTTSPSGAQSNKGQITGVAISATPNDGYEFVNWTIESGTGSFGNTTSASTTFYPTSAATIRANFRSIATNSLTVAAGAHVGTVTGSTDPVTLGNSYAISASNFDTGYEFYNWTASPAANATFANASSASTNVTVVNGSVTVTANARERMSTLSTSCSYDAGNPSYAIPTKTVSSIGISTTANLSATAPSTGYTFVGWTLSSNIVVTSGNAATDRSITIRTNGNGAAATAQANYTEDLSSPWTIKGGTNITGNNWSTAYNMTKKSGHSTESVVYYTFNISSTNSGVSGSADDWSFKVIKDGSTWYGLFASDSYWWKRGTSANQPLTGEQNIQICADVAGTYEIKVDYSTATPEVTVTFPTKYTVTYSVAPSGAANAITTSPSVASGGSVAAGTSMTFTHAAAKTGYSWYRWENGSGSSLGTGSTYTTTINANTTVVAKYTENTFNVTATASTGGSATPASATSMGQVTGGDITASPNTGYNFTNWTITSGSGYFGTSGTATTSTTANTKFRPTAAATIQANFTPKQTTITLNNQDATTSGTTEVTATFDAAMPAITLPEKTGYTFGGYWGAPGGSGPQYYNADGSSTQNWDNGNATTYTLFAKWTPKQSALTFDYQIGVTGYGSSGDITNASGLKGTYDADMTALTGTMPSAAEGYAFMGFYDATGGGGTKYYNADGSSAHTWDKDVTTGTTLYAYYKKAEITAITFDAAVVEASRTVSFAVTVSPTPTGTTKLCFTVLHSNNNPLAEQPTITYNGGTGKYSFTAPAASGTYKVEAVLRTGSSCDGGTELDTEVASFQVAGTHTVTVRYKCGGEDIKAATALDGIRPLDWSDEITAPDIIGYSFTDWTAGDGVSLTDDNGTTTKTSTTEADIKIKAIYDGYLTANYSKKRIIYFNNTLNWENVYVYFYKNGTYWDATYGTGCNGTYQYTDYPFSEGLYGQMLPVEEGSKIYYFDAEAAGVNASYQTVVFTELDQHTYNWFSKTGNVKNKVIKRDDYYSTKMPMYVPLAVQTPDSKNGNNADYYWQGYWMNYPENTGYTLKIYNKKTRSDAPDAGSKDPVELKSIPFEFTADKTMPMELDVDLEAGQTYGFKIYRNDGLNTGAGSFYGNGGTMTANSEGWDMKTGKANCGLQTTAAGNYKFVLNFYEISSDYQYRVSVTYPVAVGDYRIVYTDGATWSGSAHGASWNHPSGVIAKNSSATETKKDTVSFFWSYGSTPAIKYQTCTAVAAGSASWNAGTSIDVSGFSSVLTKEGVYNFIFEQPADGASISLIKVEPYTGNFYIRTDCAGSTKWANFRSLDHQMTYSDYAEVNSGYSHYYTHWVTNGTNVKFCIANDYSQCITDTLTQDYGTTIANIDAAGALNSASANIRFMWNQSTNKVSRAYIGGSTNISERFLVLEGDAKMFDENGNPLNITGLNPNEANLIDVQNFVYERTIQVNTKARAKLTAKYNNNIQYFKGSEGTFADGTTIELLGGDAIGKHTMRIVYDFKTNRLVTAYVPSGTIDDDIAINADLMIVREHQGAGQQLLFEGDGAALSKVHTVYGVMRFNRWTLNNKEKTGGHSPVGDPKSIYERSLYWISFPFNVNLSDVFGFGTYGVDWIIEYYDGAERATNGYWIDSDGFWKMVMPAQRATFTLEAGKGYVLAIDIDAMKDNNKTFWANNIEQVELFFPSATNVENITQTTAHTTVPEHECTIDRRTDKSVNNINKDRTKADSHWNMIGIPSYANYGATLTSDEKGTHTITWNSNPYTNDLPFLYEWNMTDDSYTVQSGTTYPFKAMHSYMVQYHGDLYWSLASATPTPSPIVARRAYAEKPQNAEFRLELQQNEKMVDQTFVNMKDAEEISAGFKFDEDLCKEFNAGKANIYTLIENYLPAAGNTLPMSDQTTLVPVGVKTTAAGEYTFAMPEGTSGVSVVLIDNIAGTRTNLALSDYTVTLSKGDLSDRFMLEIAPIKQMPTDIENVQGDNVHSTKVRKVMIDGILYIVKDGKVFDARGAKVK